LMASAATGEQREELTSPTTSGLTGRRRRHFVSPCFRYGTTLREKPRPRCEINSSADSKTPDGNSEIESRRSQSERLALKLKTTSASGTKRTNH
jgi:hypothetical protein